MFGIPLIEWIGYLASILIAISMFMKDIVKLRFINLVGSLLFAFYGFSIKAYPVAIINSKKVMYKKFISVKDKFY